MKISKFLLLTPCIALTAIPVTSCGQQQSWTIDDIEDAIFTPHDLSPQEPKPKPVGCTTFADCLLTLSEKDKQKELIYSIYAPLVYTKIPDITGENTLYDAWEGGYVNISANIAKCSMTIDGNKDVYANFTGYINFVFTKQWGEDFKKNDYIQITITFDKMIVNPFAWHIWYLNYPQFEEGHHFCWGFYQTSKWPSPIYIDQIGCKNFTDYPINWHNWKSDN